MDIERWGGEEIALEPTALLVSSFGAPTQTEGNVQGAAIRPNDSSVNNSWLKGRFVIRVHMYEPFFMSAYIYRTIFSNGDEKNSWQV